MDIIESENIKVPNSVLVKPITGIELDNEITEHLAKIGAIERVIKVDSQDPKFKDSAIVEFKSGESIQFLQDSLPCDKPSSDPTVVHSIQLLSDLYASDRGSSITKAYLTELQSVAKLVGVDFEKILLDELTRIQKSSSSFEPVDVSVTCQEPQTSGEVLIEQSTNESMHGASNKSAEHDLESVLSAEPVVSPKKQTVVLNTEQLTSPEIHKVVVEHFIKNADLPSQGHAKLRTFSGKTSSSYPESDYDTWRSNIEFVVSDPTVSDKHKVRRILESLAPPAANIVKHLGTNATPRDYLSLLDSAYDTVDDGDELFAKFLNINQNPGEKSSEYLQRLQIALNKVIKRGGMQAHDSDRQLLKQFCRGCWNNSIITTLQLEQKKNKPPVFADLLLMLRIEEDRQAAKSSRMKQHFGSFKTKAQTNSLTVEEVSQYNQWTADETSETATANEKTQSTNTQKLEKQLIKLQAQMASLKASLSNTSNQSPIKPNKKPKSKAKTPDNPNPISLPENKPLKRPRPGYCFRCGEDGHIVPSCTNEPNPNLVEEKRKEFKKKQQVFDEQSKTSLN